MDKKNSCYNSVRSSNVRTWTPPTIHRGKENYVDFYALDPSTGKLRRKKIMIDHFHTQRQRNNYARQLIEELTQKLIRGWNPWVEQKSSAQFTPWEDVCAAYRQYVTKLHNESAFSFLWVKKNLCRKTLVWCHNKSDIFVFFYCKYTALLSYTKILPFFRHYRNQDDPADYSS